MTMYRKSAAKNHLQPVHSAPFGDHYHEEDLETLLEQNSGVLAEGEPLLIFSRQPNAQESGTPDLLAFDADRAFRDKLLTVDEQIRVEPRKTGISFYKQTRDGRVFLGTISPSRGGMRLWFRRDSLQDRLDLDVMEETIGAHVPADIVFRQTGENDHRFDFAARVEDGRVVAGLILDHIANELD